MEVFKLKLKKLLILLIIVCILPLAFADVEEKVVRVSVNVSVEGTMNDDNKTEIKVKLHNNQNSYEMAFYEDTIFNGIYDFYDIKEITCETKNIENLTSEFITYCKEYRSDCQDTDDIPYKYKYEGLVNNYNNIKDFLDTCQNDLRDMNGNITEILDNYHSCNTELIVSRNKQCVEEEEENFDYVYAFLLGLAAGLIIMHQYLTKRKSPDTGPGKLFPRPSVSSRPTPNNPIPA